jgi:hypothetical protein
MDWLLRPANLLLTVSGVTNGVLTEAYERFLPTGPAWGEDKLTNHGPMAVEVLVRRGHEDDVHGWVDAYLGRLDDLPAAGDRITDVNLTDALGDGRWRWARTRWRICSTGRSITATST